MSNKIRHGLKILSLHDARAECLCGGWSYTRTGEAARKEVVHQYAQHLHLQPLGSWSAKVIHKEDMRQYIGQEVEVLAIYGRKRRFVVGEDSKGELIEFYNGSSQNSDERQGQVWTWCESEYATVKVVGKEDA